MSRWNRFAAIAVVAGVTVVLAACTAAPVEPPPSPASTQGATPSTTPTATAPPAPELVPEGTAEDNLEYFDLVNTTLFANGNPGGRAIIDNLVAAGLDKSAMQVMADRTPRGDDVDSLQFAVQLGADCLIGQIGTAGYVSVVAPALASGGCLVGNTRPIDW